MSASDPLLRHSSTALGYPEWQRLYQAALLEVDPKRLADRVAEAEAAIFGRLQQLSEISESQDRQAERHANPWCDVRTKGSQTESLNSPD